MAFAGADAQGMYYTYEQPAAAPRTMNKGQDSNVLLCSIEEMQYPVTIEDIHRVFSLCGFVCKISTFEKAAGFQVLVQYPDIATAVNAQSTLEGYNIFEGCCRLRISFSRHTDLNVRFNSDRSRDYTVGMPGGTDPSLFGNSAAVAGGKPETPSNVLLVSVEDHYYPLTIQVLNHVFSAYGTVQKLALFEKKGGFQALVQMSTVDDASRSKAALDGHQVYEGCCRLRISYSQHTNLNVKRNSDTTWDYTGGALDAGAQMGAPMGGSPMAHAPQSAVPQGTPASYATPEVFASCTSGLPFDYLTDPRWGLYAAIASDAPLDPRLYYAPADPAAPAVIESAAVAAGFPAMQVAQPAVPAGAPPGLGAPPPGLPPGAPPGAAGGPVSPSMASSVTPLPAD